MKDEREGLSQPWAFILHPMVFLRAFPEEAEEHADAGGDEDGLDGLFVDVGFEGFLPLGGLFAALVVVVGGLLAEVVVLFAGGVAVLGGDVLDLLADLGGGFLELLGGALGLVL